MVQLLFANPLLDAVENFIQLDHPTLTPNFLDYISLATSSKDLNRKLMGLLDAHLAENDRKSR